MLTPYTVLNGVDVEVEPFGVLQFHFRRQARIEGGAFYRWTRRESFAFRVDRQQRAVRFAAGVRPQAAAAQQHARFLPRLARQVEHQVEARARTGWHGVSDRREGVAGLTVDADDHRVEIFKNDSGEARVAGVEKAQAHARARREDRRLRSGF